MARKFFNDRVPNTKKTITNLIIIGVCIIGVIVCFIVTSNFQGESTNGGGGELSLNKSTIVEVNEEITNDIFFSKIENVNLNAIKVDYPSDFDISEVGDYQINITINGKKYNTILKVVDTIKPELTVKEYTITQNSAYIPKNFVSSCKDNSGKDCILDFYEGGIDEEGNNITYNNYYEPGTYAIKISAKDAAGNETVEETKLIITATGSTQEPPVEDPKPTECKYGNSEYDTEEFLVAVNVTTNNCAVSLDLYKDSAMTAEINKMMDAETIRIKRDVESLKLDGTLALNRKVTAVVNTSGDGVVGYELQMTVTITKNGTTETIADYKLNSSGKRVFISNPNDLSE